MYIQPYECISPSARFWTTGLDLDPGVRDPGSFQYVNARGVAGDDHFDVAISIAWSYRPDEPPCTREPRACNQGLTTLSVHTGP